MVVLSCYHVLVLPHPEWSTTPSTLRVRCVLRVREMGWSEAGGGGDNASCNEGEEQDKSYSTVD